MNKEILEKSDNYQKTIKKSVCLTGISLHKGLKSTVTIKPNYEDTGITFIRTDLNKNNIVKATYKNVSDTTLCTVISNKYGCKVSTIEHLMSALFGKGIDNAIIEVNCEELPALDGSAYPYIDLLNQTGCKKLNKFKKIIKIKKTVTVSENDKIISIEPCDNFEIHMKIDHTDKMIGKQFFNFIFSESSFLNQISKARTYGFMSDAKELFKRGYAIGASTKNALVFNNNTVLNQEGMRFNNEPVRHKILDCIGDLFLSGFFIQGKVNAFKSGHEMNSKLIFSIFSSKENWEIYDPNEIFINKYDNNYKISAIA